jgi:pyrimidine-nucleoside phosphorylase
MAEESFAFIRKAGSPMRAVDIIIKKREKEELSEAEIGFLVEGFTNGDIPDYQMSAWAMAVLLNDMSDAETTALTMALARSGEMLDLSDVAPMVVDKHSSGGVGDKTTLVSEPIVAACGLPVGKMSGRGLGFSGGTLDKLESIAGFRTDLTMTEFLDQLRTHGIVLIGQTGEIAPADGKLYALRDVSGTVEAIPLLASSIMSKKIAAGAQALVLDVKVGLGAFKPKLEDGRRLAELMVAIAKLTGRKATALLSDMNQPLGLTAGNALEVREAIETLHGGGPADFREHSLTVATHMLVLGGLAADESAAWEKAEAALDGGDAWERFRTLVQAQGGDVACIDQPDLLPTAPLIETFNSPQGGYISQIHARVIGETVVELGGGRAKKGDPIDHSVGIEIFHKVGDRVEEGEPLFTVHANNDDKLAHASTRVFSAYTWSDEPVEPLPLFYGIIR